MKTYKKTQDCNVFREAMADVRPLGPTNRIEPEPRKPPATASQLEKDNREALRDLLDSDPGELLENGEELLYLKPGLQARVLRRLRRGHYSVGDTIDLHHMDVPTAKQVLLDFLEQSLHRGLSCVRIVHGKGLRSRDLPRLKPMTNRVLRKHARVIAFASCRPIDGGTGACDVLLSKRSGKGR
jgi:DNA-nicking Smr family endonuclease